jgi:4-hydroxy-3-polyprenylbenzoate decarboxylase
VKTGHGKRIIIGISGSSGVIYGIRLLELLKNTDIETHLVISRSAQITIAQGDHRTVSEVTALADIHHKAEDIGASISSGSFRTIGMIVAPCSMRSLSEITVGSTTSLLTRAADVTLKECRRLVMMVRETPLHLGHLKSMVAATEIGAVICPPGPAFYTRPSTIQDIVDHSVGRVLDLFGIDAGIVKRRKEMPG